MHSMEKSGVMHALAGAVLVIIANTAVQACVTDADCEDGNPCSINICQNGLCAIQPADPRTVCRSVAGACDVAEYCDGVSFICPADLVVTSGTECRSVAGDCDVAEVCDGVSALCPTDGFVDAGTQCRAAAGVCDVPEACDGASAACPADAVADAGAECRAAVDVCDLAESCDGVSVDCPADALESAGTECRAVAGDCDTAEVCDGLTADCPTDAFLDPGTECRAASGDCDVAEVCDGVSADCPTNLLIPAGVECRPQAGPCDLPDACTGTSPDCPMDLFEPTTTRCRPGPGICDVEEFCTGTGPDCPPDGFEPNTLECKPVAGPCDVAEFCTGSSSVCPTDVFEPSTLECRAAADVCDVAEFCTGSAADCPADSFQSGTVECRAAVDICDVSEFCTGSAAGCPPDEVIPPDTLECRPAVGVCDIGEWCTGSSPACPPDVFKPATQQCRPGPALCDVPEYCTGTGPDCPPDGFEPDTVECRGAEGPCDVSEFCTGLSTLCPDDVLESAGTECRAIAGICDAPEFCDGVSVDCPADGRVPAGTECRPVAGGCDVAEVCDGASADCPMDTLASAGTECRAAAGVCDTVEVCDGVSPDCPTDEIMPSGTECRPTAGDCDVPEMCDGILTDCPGDGFAAGGTQCRAAVDLCDVAEVCDGASLDCPTDAVAPSGAECRPAAGECDVAEHCDGLEASCPVDTMAPNGVVCTDDGNTCTDDTCRAGLCTHFTNDLCGGCCLNENSCVDEVSEDDCALDLGGVWSGGGSSCLGDATSNGIDDACEQVDFHPCRWQAIAASDASANARFGIAVAVSGASAVVGAYLDDGMADGAGAAYVLARTGTSWLEETKLTASDATAEAQFGFAVAIDGDFAVIGAQLESGVAANAGAAYVFQRDVTDWIEQAKLVAPDAEANDQFGTSVSLSGDLMVVGAPLKGDMDPHSGAAYVFRRQGSDWVEEARLVASDAATDDRFGISVAVDGDSVVVGANLNDDAGAGSGSAYVFRRGALTWIQEAKLTASDATAQAQFGLAVAIDGDDVVVAAPTDGHVGANAGAAYVFRYDGAGWVEEAKLTASDAAPDDRFGSSISISGDLVLVGAHQDDDGESNAGSAYVFRRTGTTWGDETKLTASDPAAGDAFGRSTAIGGKVALIGAPFRSDGDSRVGWVFAVDVAGSDADADGVHDLCDACPGFNDADDEDGDGVPDGCDVCPHGDDHIDCQPNAVPDACDLFDGTSEDCNANQVPDECDIAEGTSLDMNGNGVPDECDGLCLPPLVEAAGSRYIAITPQPMDFDGPMAFVITSSDWPCLNKYVGGFRECGDTGIRCRTVADCNECDQISGPCLSDDDCKLCTDNTTRCRMDADCPTGFTCTHLEACLISGNACDLQALRPIDLNRDGLDDGMAATLVDDPADASVLTPAEWGTMFRRCSISFEPCAVDGDCDVGICSVSGLTCSIAGQDCSMVCDLGQTECEVDAHCEAIPGDTCSGVQSCEPYEACDPGKVYVTGKDILPSELVLVDDDYVLTPTRYEAAADCGGLTDPVAVTMRVWCDANADAVINFDDIQSAILAFEGRWPPRIPPRTLVAMDVVGGTVCKPEQVLNFSDIQRFVLAFEGQSYNPNALAGDETCDVPCP